MDHRYRLAHRHSWQGVVISGTAEAGATVILTDGNGNPIGQVTADGSGNWTLETHPAAPDLAAGHQLQLRLARRQAAQLVDQLL